MRLDDYCCLGRTVPENSKKYGKTVCSAGYSEEMRQLIRVYPLPVVNPIRQRTVSVLELERCATDSRVESWKLARSRDDAGIVSVGPKRSAEQIRAWLGRGVSPSIAWLNDRRLSLGVIRPAKITPYFLDRATGDVGDPHQKLLFQDLDDSFGANAIRFAPYLGFRDEDGKHNLQLREWGCYEWLRKEPGKESQLWENLKLTVPNRDVLLVVGNMCHQRTSWLIISVLSQERVTSLFPPEVTA